MRKIFTLLFAMIIAVVANAQVLINYEHTADLPAGIAIGGTTVMKSVKIHENTDAVDCIQLANGYTTDGALNGNCVTLTTDGGFKSGDVVEIAGFFNNSDDTKNSAFVIYVEDASEAGYTVLWTSEKLINARLVADEPRVDTYTLAQDAAKLCIARQGNTGTNIYTLTVTRSAGGDTPIVGGLSANITQYPTTDYSTTKYTFPLANVATSLGMEPEAFVTGLENWLGGKDGDLVMIGLIGDVPTTVWEGSEEASWGGVAVEIPADLAAGLKPGDKLRISYSTADGQWMQYKAVKMPDWSSINLGGKEFVTASDLTDWAWGEAANRVDTWELTQEMIDGIKAENKLVLQGSGGNEGGVPTFTKVEIISEGFMPGTANDNGSYWYTADGKVTTWGNSSVVFSDFNYSLADGTFDILLGQMPDAMQPGDVWQGVINLYHDSDVAPIRMTLEVEARPVMQEPTTSYAALEIVKEYTMPIAFVEGKQYEDISNVLDVADIYEALGVDAKTLDPNSESVTMTRAVVNDEAGSIQFSDSLVASRFGTDGWFGRHTSFDESTGNETTLPFNGPKGWGANCTFYIQNAAIADGVFSMANGQYPGTLKDGDEDKVELYIVNGTKAAKITVVSTCKAAEVVPFESMTKVGEASYAGTLEVANAYTSVVVDIDAADIIAKLGDNTDDYMHWNFSAEGGIMDAATNDYWQNEEGVSLAWSNSPCCQVTIQLAAGTATLLQMAEKYMDITEAQTFPMHYIISNGANYYQLDFQFTLKPLGKIENEPYCVAVKEIAKQIIPANSYDVDGLTDLDLDYIESMIGTRDFTLYGDVYDGEKLVMTKNYTCYDTANKGYGFWYGTKTYENAEHQVVVDNAGWSGSGDNSFGIQIFTNGKIMWFQYPGTSQVGDAWTSNVYLVNETTGAYLKYILNVKYVSEITPDAEEVANVNWPLPYADKYLDKDGLLSAEFPVAQLCEALGIAVDDFASVKILAPKSKTIYADVTPGEDMFFSRNGYVVPETSVELISNLTVEDGIIKVSIDPMETSIEENDAYVRYAFEANGKRFVLNYQITKPGDTIGLEDNTSAWWTAFSEFFTLSKGQTATVSFINYNDGDKNWNNWVLVTQKAGNTTYGAGNDEYFALRADNYGWGTYYDETTLYNDYNWDTFMKDMNGAHVGMSITLNEAGQIVVSAAISTADYKTYSYSYTSKSIGADSFNFFYTAEKAHLEDFRVSISGDATAIADVTVDVPSVKKVVRNGKVIIVKGDAEFNVTGARIK